MEIVKFNINETDDHITSHGGLGLIGLLLNKTNLKLRINEVKKTGLKDDKISNGDIVTSMIGLMCIGKPDYEAIEIMREEPFFIYSLGIDHCPACTTLRQRIDLINGKFDEIIKEESAILIRNVAPGFSKINSVNGELVPLDIDVSPFDNSDTKKEGVSMTYKGYEGYAPIFGYLGKEGYEINVELREGKQHSQKNTPNFLKETIRYAKIIVEKGILVRMDAGNDSIENIEILEEEEVDWIIKRNLRREKQEEWYELGKKEGKEEQLSEGIKIYRGETERKIEGAKKPLRIIYEIKEKIKEKGQWLLIPEIEIGTYWTSLKDGAEKVIELYHDHGTSEQYHSEIKTDMNLERLPSSRFKVNSDIMTMGLMAYNLLRLCGQESLKEENVNIEKRISYRKRPLRRRLRTVMQDLMYIGLRITYHARKIFISLGRYNPYSKVFKNLYQGFMNPIR